MLEIFSKWAEQIDNEWPNHSTSYDKQVFIVYDNLKKEVARVDYNDGRFDISGDDLPTVKRLTDLTQHRH